MGRTPIDYTRYDFNDLVGQLINKLIEGGSVWKDTYVSSSGTTLIDLFSYLANLMMYATERQAEEGYLNSARLRSSVQRNVSLLNYKVSRPISATGQVVFTIPQTIAYDIYLPKGTQVKTGDGYIFSLIQDYYLTAGNTTVTCNVVQGVLSDVSFTSNGLSDQYINVPFTNVENTNVTVFVDGTQWTVVDTLLNSIGTDQHCIITQESDDTITVRFGDGVSGAIPTIASTVVVNFIKSDGAAGNVYEAAKITTVVSKIYDTQGNQITNITVNNTGQLLGGADAEDIEHIRYYAPLLFAAGQRAVTKNDFKALINSYPGVADSNVWGELENGVAPDYNQFNKVNICLLLQGWFDPDNTFKTNLGTYLRDKSLLTVKYEFTQAKQMQTLVLVDLVCKTGSDLSQIRNAVSYAIAGQFDLGNTTKFGEKINASSVYDVVRAISNVVYPRVELKIEESVTWSATNNRWEHVIPMLPIKPGSVEIYFGSTLVAVDDGFNTIKKITGGTYTVDGEVEYSSTGLLYFTTNTTPSTVTVRYKQPDGDLTPYKNQILKLNRVIFGSITYQ